MLIKLSKLRSLIREAVIKADDEDVNSMEGGDDNKKSLRHTLDMGGRSEDMGEPMGDEQGFAGGEDDEGLSDNDDVDMSPAEPSNKMPDLDASDDSEGDEELSSIDDSPNTLVGLRQWFSEFVAPEIPTSQIPAFHRFVKLFLEKAQERELKAGEPGIKRKLDVKDKSKESKTQKKSDKKDKPKSKSDEKGKNKKADDKKEKDDKKKNEGRRRFK